MASIILTDIQKLPITVSAVDAEGNPTPLPTGALSFAVVPPEVGSVVPDPADTTGTKFFFETPSPGPLGDAQIQAKLDLGGGNILTGTLDVSVVASAAATISIAPGAPV